MELTELRRDRRDLLPPGMGRSAMQKTLERLDRAFDAFFRRVRAGSSPGYPRFRSIQRFDSLGAQYGQKCRLVHDSRRLYWGGAGEIAIRLHRPLPEDARILEIQIKRLAGKWYACINVDVPAPLALPPTGRSVGIDLGVSTFAALSTGALIPGPRVARKCRRRVAHMQRMVARRRAGSNRQAKAVRLLAAARAKEARVRLDHHHKLARALVVAFDHIYLENLDVHRLGRSRLSREVHDQGWAQFVRITADKAEEAGRLVIAVDPRHTSQECSGCGNLPAVRKPLRQRIHSCCSCGLVLDRDVNAAKNILRRGERQREALGAEREIAAA
jgi:putative transposase